MIKCLFIFLALLFDQGDVSREVYVDVDGAKIYCKTVGHGNPLVVIHGGPGLTQDYLLPALNELAADHLVIFYDQRGGGKSSGEINEETMNVTTFVKDLETLRKTFKFEKISILGHSWGGLLAMHYAVAHPESVDKLILSNSMAASSEDIGVFIVEWLRRMAPYQEEMGALQDKPELQEKFNRIMFRTYFHHPDDVNLLNLQVDPLVAIRLKKINDLFMSTTFSKPFDLYPSLKKLNIPTLIIHGDDDPIPLSTIQHIHDSISKSKYHIIKECGHFPYIEKPEVYFKLIKEFLCQR